MRFRVDFLTLLMIVLLVVLGSISYTIISTAYESRIPARLELIKACRDEFGRRKNVAFCDRTNDKKGE